MLILAAGLAYLTSGPRTPARWWSGGLVSALGLVIAGGCFTVPTGEARILTFLGRYMGTVRREGLQWTMPLSRRRKIFLGTHATTCEPKGVIDREGTEIDVEIRVEWNIDDTAAATYRVESPEETVRSHADAVTRTALAKFSYETPKVPGEVTILRDQGTIADQIKHALAERSRSAGIAVTAVRFHRLAHGSEMLEAMRRRRTADEFIAARAKVLAWGLKSASETVERLAEAHGVDFSPREKAQAVAELLVALCGDGTRRPTGENRAANPAAGQ